jgi:hypothetical protein
MTSPLRRPPAADHRALAPLHGPPLNNSPARLDIADWRIRGIRRHNDRPRPPAARPAEPLGSLSAAAMTGVRRLPFQNQDSPGIGANLTIHRALPTPSER